MSIRLPFEQGANPIIAGDQKYVSMKYFFTRKLMLIKEAKAFVCLPGGFGTMDETFELLTLTQTGKGVPVPIVMLDTPGDPYWEAVEDFVNKHLVTRGLVSPRDTSLYLVTDSAEEAVAEICRFYANYHSMRFVGDRLVIRIEQAPTDEQLAALNERFSHLCTTGIIERSAPLSVELRDGDEVALPRLVFHFAKHGFGELREMIDQINSWVA
ncbi:MAG: LOG family protein [Ilumatobacteraceae bacterium]